MSRIVVQSEVADLIRQSDGPIELFDDKGVCIGVVRRPPTEAEIEFAKGRVKQEGTKFTLKELIAKVEAL